jgi:hypothetical protein
LEVPFVPEESLLFGVHYHNFPCSPGMGELCKRSFLPGWRFPAGFLLFLIGSQFGFPHGLLLRLVSQKAFAAKIAEQ